MTKTAFGELETMVGLRHNPQGLAADAELCDLVRPLITFRYDWVHSMLQGGVLNAEMEALMQAAEIAREEVQTFLRDDAWHYPHRVQTTARRLHRVFDERRVGTDDATKIKATCSELLGLYGVLRFFVELKLAAKPEAERLLNSFAAMCTVVDLLLAAKSRTVDVDQATAQLEVAVCNHLRLHLEAYGDAHVRPKHHWMVDVPAQIRSDGMVVDAFVVERIHLRVKSIAEKITNTVSFERSVLSGVLSTHMQVLEEREVGDCLLGRSAPLPGFLGARVADRMQVFGVEFWVGDVVLYGDSVAKVEACVRQCDELFACVRPFAKVADIASHAASYEPLADTVVWEASVLVHSLAWRAKSDGSMLVVRR